MDRLFIVIPCYNEEEVFPETSKRIKEKLVSLIEKGKISLDSRVLFVDDGSKDRTWEMISKLHESDPLFSGLKLSRNKGHQNALLAGLTMASEHADMTVSIDADLQDDINAIDAMIEKFRSGCDVVYGVRSKREKDSFFKRFTAESFYKLTKSLGGEIVFNHADYRLLSRRALKALLEYGESNMFLRGIVPMVGFKCDVVTYERGERFAGESKYPFKKMLAFAIDGITSLSAKPMRLIMACGVVLMFLAFLLLIYTIVTWIMGETPFNWKIITVSVWGIGGMVLTALGIVGEYVGKIYIETKKRPRFIVENIVHED